MSSTRQAKPTQMTTAAPARRPSPNRRRLIGRAALWSVAAVAVVLKVTLPIF